jgi:hypothetical protein
MGLLVGSLLGIQIGALVTKTVKGIYIRGFYATAILAGFLNRLFALPGKLGKMQVTDIFKPVSHLLDQIGIYVFFLVIGLFGIWVLTTFLKNIRRLREA